VSGVAPGRSCRRAHPRHSSPFQPGRGSQESHESRPPLTTRRGITLTSPGSQTKIAQRTVPSFAQGVGPPTARPSHFLTFSEHGQSVLSQKRHFHIRLVRRRGDRRRAAGVELPVHRGLTDPRPAGERREAGPDRRDDARQPDRLLRGPLERRSEPHEHCGCRVRGLRARAGRWSRAGEALLPASRCGLARLPGALAMRFHRRRR